MSTRVPPPIGSAAWDRELTTLDIDRPTVDRELHSAVEDAIAEGTAEPDGHDVYLNDASPETAAVLVLFHQSHPSYSALMYLSFVWHDADGRLRDWIVRQYAAMLVHGPRPVTDSATYGLAIDYFEDHKAAPGFFAALLPQIPTGNWGGLLRAAGPLTWPIKRQLFLTAAEHPGLHAALAEGMAASFFGIHRSELVINGQAQGRPAHWSSASPIFGEPGDASVVHPATPVMDHAVVEAMSPTERNDDQKIARNRRSGGVCQGRGDVVQHVGSRFHPLGDGWDNGNSGTVGIQVRLEALFRFKAGPPVLQYRQGDTPWLALIFPRYKQQLLCHGYGGRINSAAVIVADGEAHQRPGIAPVLRGRLHDGTKGRQDGRLVAVASVRPRESRPVHVSAERATTIKSHVR
ncbi:hypothetical protein [Winogradskya humida]|uniref:DUF4274 domain-containing protein n=1 Tax=Winogradskya humida TaxID=113566 RepID=A0ABQ3ZH46_9ACTN|nr:hypothetical protein [Actinoplanes humidus]GIE17911.1 hypothetical protein Ahu01nite_010130 [Actinoplanes humidus]